MVNVRIKENVWIFVKKSWRMYESSPLLDPQAGLTIRKARENGVPHKRLRRLKLEKLKSDADHPFRTNYIKARIKNYSVKSIGCDAKMKESLLNVQALTRSEVPAVKNDKTMN
ncbi:hypothetical protein LOAG_00571 [Loa loa]|uniref:Uncharacterized protein n=1 Tax=Loa loa TaxID=7209 RepID=A0A1S0UBH9_LOALO|nr:hypothetical protein LOAG_00571 [Loa loa]EFO27910.1 hypothetical protein LOAG_00571 [Loa loa]